MDAYNWSRFGVRCMQPVHRNCFKGFRQMFRSFLCIPFNQLTKNLEK